MSHLRAFFCREYRDYALFGVEFLAEICQKFSEILRILAEILRKKLATGASDTESFLQKSYLNMWRFEKSIFAYLKFNICIP